MGSRRGDIFCRMPSDEPQSVELIVPKPAFTNVTSPQPGLGNNSFSSGVGAQPGLLWEEFKTDGLTSLVLPPWREVQMQGCGLKASPCISPFPSPGFH